ncbi:hypothetical protein FO519_009283 [Halicephalobus sp. NKZ332]|nr:hypothetical protein FO519_009283 [Halicephalobus sp. NKZ332]
MLLLVCDNCTLSQINLVQGDNTNSVTPTLSSVESGNDGCLTVMATCDVSDISGATTLMKFQDGTPGPTTSPDSAITADLFCINGSWIFTQDGTSTVSQISCDLNTPPIPSCETCTADQVTLVPMMGDGTATPTADNPTSGPDGCLMLTVTCPASSDGGMAFMMFNGGGQGPASLPNSPVMATLDCVGGNWQTNVDGTQTNITSVNCIVT